jgi:hypothetical protein
MRASPISGLLSRLSLLGRQNGGFRVPAPCNFLACKPSVSRFSLATDLWSTPPDFQRLAEANNPQ